MNHQMYEIVTLPARRVTGIAVRTSNAAPDCAQKIGDLWQRYLRGGGARGAWGAGAAACAMACTPSMPAMR